jgi:hypothetical protein
VYSDDSSYNGGCGIVIDIVAPALKLELLANRCQDVGMKGSIMDHTKNKYKALRHKQMIKQDKSSGTMLTWAIQEANSLGNGLENMMLTNVLQKVLQTVLQEVLITVLHQVAVVMHTLYIHQMQSTLRKEWLAYTSSM